MNHSTQNKNETPAHIAKQEMGWNEGRIVFTNSKDLVGVGLPRKGSRTTPKTCITTHNGKTKDGITAGKTYPVARAKSRAHSLRHLPGPTGKKTIE